MLEESAKKSKRRNEHALSQHNSYCKGDVSKNTFGDRLMKFMVHEFVETIERRVHQFHAYPTVSLTRGREREREQCDAAMHRSMTRLYLFEKSTIESNDMWTRIFTHDDIEFIEHLLLTPFVDSGSNPLDNEHRCGSR